MKPESMKPEFGEIKDAGMCAHGNFKDSCAACEEENKQTDEKLSLEEAQEEAGKIQDRALAKRAEEYEQQWRAEHANNGYSDHEYNEMIAHRVKIKRGKAEQPSGKQYDIEEKLHQKHKRADERLEREGFTRGF